MIKDVIKQIRKFHNYKVTPEYFGRIGKIIQRYGEDTVILSIKKLPSKEIPLTDMLNIVEKKCQYLLENNGTMDDLEEDILNSL